MDEFPIRRKKRKEFEYAPESDFPVHEHYTKQGPIQRISGQETDIYKRKITKKKR